MYFRDYPFKGGYAVACGMAQLADLVETFRFSEEDIAYLASLDAPAGGPLFDPAFLEYLQMCIRDRGGGFYLAVEVAAFGVDGAVGGEIL